ncbi:hypothetical protein GGD67_002632 [Bradyrhizobium sp. IAR9]|nr:hypothetical protein [Bradyrhizobium sp. IAR9]
MPNLGSCDALSEWRHHRQLGPARSKCIHGLAFVVSHLQLQACLDAYRAKCGPNLGQLCCGLTLLPTGMAIGLVCSLKGGSSISPASLGSRDRRYLVSKRQMGSGGTQRPASGRKRCRGLVLVNAASRSPMAEQRRAIHRTIFELLARRLEGHEDHCSFQDMIAQELGKINESRGCSAYELQKVEGSNTMRDLSCPKQKRTTLSQPSQ